ncbi:hypothetical protein B0O99DRAFT_118594 [Bisporella sp. PMI_857]|nr:hypothetical protein B0O99DRAFT_118594 [Bisporella sp. PMI_857]
MAKTKGETHAEIWDDSMLVNSWNDALEEYKQYHSIQAQGENVEDVLKAYEEGNDEIHHDHDVIVNDDSSQLDTSKTNLHAKHSLANGTVDHTTSKEGPQVEIRQRNSSGIPGSKHSTGLAVPQHLIGQVHDEGLKNLLMSWYYAGYYTGLYEGRQESATSKDA